ncbi:MAG: oligosaccharide flippase family protein [Pseudomonadota bacterium]
MQVVSDTQDLLRSAVAQIFGFAGRLAARAGFIVIAAGQYGDIALGQLGLVAAISEIAVALGVLGLKRSLLDQLSALAEAGQPVGPRVSEALFISSLFGLGIAFCLSFIWPLVIPGAGFVWLCLSCMIPFNVFSEVALTAIKYKRVVQWEVWARSIAESWVLFGLAVLFLVLDWKDVGLPLAYALSLYCVTAIATIGLFKTYRMQDLKLHWVSWTNIFEIPKRSYQVGITDLGTMALRRIDLIVMSVFVSPAAAGLYFMIQQIATLSQRIPALFEPMLSPILAQLHNQGKTAGIRANLKAICRWIFILTVSLTIPISIFGEPILSLFNPAFSAGVVVLAIVLIAELIDGTFISAETPLIFTHPKIPPVIILSTLAMEIGLIALLTHIYGIIGAAIGFLLSMLFLSLARLVLLWRKLAINALSKAYIQPVLYALLMSASLWAASDTLLQLPNWTLAITIAATTASYLASIRFFALSPSDKLLLKLLARRKNQRR